MADAVYFQFIGDSLDKYGKDVKTAMIRSIDRLDAIDTQFLKNNISYDTKVASGYNEGSSELSFAEHGRMVDMGVGKGRSLKINSDMRREKILKKKPGKKFYSPIAYGLLNPLINRLQYGYTQAVILSTKEKLNPQI